LTDSPEHGGKGMTFDSVLTQIFTTLIGGGGIMGIMFYYLKRYIDKRITAEEKEASERAEIRTRRLAVEHKLRHAYGSLFFWLHKAVTKPPQAAAQRRAGGGHAITARRRSGKQSIRPRNYIQI